MKRFTFLILVAIMLFLPFSCKKAKEINVTLITSLSDYNSYQATYVSIQSITLGEENVTYDFDTWSNIGVSDIREIPITITSKEDEFVMTVIAGGVGSGITKESTVNGVKDGDLLYLDLDNNNLSVYNSTSNCFIGKWRRPVTNCNNAYNSFKFYSDGSGILTQPIVQGSGASCTILCSVDFYFNWTYNSDGTILLDYYDAQSPGCSTQPTTPSSNDNFSISCNGTTSITVEGLVYDSY